MQIVFLIFMLFMGAICVNKEERPPEKKAIPLPQTELSFWPPDLVPHPPHPPKKSDDDNWA